MAPDESRAAEQGAMIEQTVDDAIARGDFHEAARIAAGHPSAAKHAELNRRVYDAKEARKSGRSTVPPAAAAELAQDAPAPATDLAGDELPPPSKMFEIRRKSMRIKSVNARAEANGDGKRPAMDVAFVVNLEQTALDPLDRSLRTWLFAKPGKGSDLADSAHPAPHVRQPRIKAEFAWIVKYAGYEVRIHDLGLDASRDLILRECDFNKLTLAPQEGGTVIASFRVQFHPTEAQAGKLATLVGAQVDASLLAPEGAGEVDEDEPDAEE